MIIIIVARPLGRVSKTCLSFWEALPWIPACPTFAFASLFDHQSEDDDDGDKHDEDDGDGDEHDEDDGDDDGDVYARRWPRGSSASYKVSLTGHCLRFLEDGGDDDGDHDDGDDSDDHSDDSDDGDDGDHCS